MKKIGILFGQENEFPQALIDRINEMNDKNVVAEAVKIDIAMQGQVNDYAVIIDRVSHHVPFYKAYLKNAALSGTAVINNPFAISSDDNFYVNALAERMGIPVPKAILLPSNQRPEGTSAETFSNLVYPMNWEGIFNHINFPAVMKPLKDSNEKNFSKFDFQDDFFSAHNQTGQQVMMIVEDIKPQEFYKCYCIGGKEIRTLQYDPETMWVIKDAGNKKAMSTIKDYATKLCSTLGYDINVMHFGVVNGQVYALDICNPAPKADTNLIGQENFDWLVDTTAALAIRRAKAHKEGGANLTWGTFMKDNSNGIALPAMAAPKESKKSAATEEKNVVKGGKVVKQVGSKAEGRAATARKESTKGSSKKGEIKAS